MAGAVAQDVAGALSRMWLVLRPGCGVIAKASYGISMTAYGTGACFASATIWDRIGSRFPLYGISEEGRNRVA